MSSEPFPVFLVRLAALCILFPDWNHAEGAEQPVAAPFQLVSGDGRGIPVVLAGNVAPSAKRAAEDLCGLIGVMSGAQPNLLIGTPDIPPESAIWIGYQPHLQKIFPGGSFELEHPEEIYILGNGRHVAIIGRDQIIEGKETQFGTSHAVHTFMEKYLGVRWFWPGELGQEVPRQTQIEPAVFEYRFHPVFRQRVFSEFPSMMERREENRHWLEVLQRGRGSLTLDIGHAFTSWWEQYHEQDPGIFAMRAPGDRTPEENPKLVKLCDSNPRVAELWLAEAEDALSRDASIFSLSATPNDSGGWCLCDACRKWDHPDGPPSMYQWGGETINHVMLTDRMVRLWNTLGRGLKEIAPGREVYVGALAYTRYKTPPVEAQLMDNIIVGYVGSFPLARPDRTREEKEEWKEWASRAELMMYRPNLFPYTGGPWGLPNIVLDQTAEDFRFLAENRCIGLYVDAMFFNWSTVGPQNYLMAQMAYDPMADGQKIMEDYYEKAFGPASAEVKAHFELMEKALQDFMAWEDFFPSGGIRYSGTNVFPETFSPALLDQAEEHLSEAAKKAGDAPGVYKDRVAFVRAGLDFTRLQLEIMRAMRKVRETKGSDRTALVRAQELIQSREDLLAGAPPFAFDAARLASQTRFRKMEDYLGPVAEKFLNAGNSDATPARPQEQPARDPKSNVDLD